MNKRYITVRTMYSLLIDYEIEIKDGFVTSDSDGGYYKLSAHLMGDTLEVLSEENFEYVVKDQFGNRTTCPKWAGEVREDCPCLDDSFREENIRKQDKQIKPFDDTLN